MKKNNIFPKEIVSLEERLSLTAVAASLRGTKQSTGIMRLLHFVRNDGARFATSLRGTKQSILAAMLSLTVVSCGEPLMDATVDTSAPVVEGFLQEGAKTMSVKLYTMEQYLEDDVALSQPITGLSVTINDYALTETESGTYSYSFADDDSIKAGATYTLRFTYNDVPIEASTTIPQKVSNIVASPDTLTISSYYMWYNTDDTIEVNVTWDDPDGSYYQVYMESPNTTDLPSMGVFGRRMMQPTKGASYTAGGMEFRSAGIHYIYVYRVNKDYVDLYERISSFDLANPVRSIPNAFGVFTSMSMNRVRIVVFEDD